MVPKRSAHDLELLKDRVALVTGASKGIGRAICLSLARAGADVAVNARNHNRLELVAAEIRALGRRAVVVPADVSARANVEAMIATVAATFGRIDILVNNAGGGIGYRFVEDISEEEWEWILALNLKSVFLTCRTVAPHMIRQGGGRIINISSVAGKFKPSGMTSAAYCAAKSGIMGLTRQLTVLLAPHGIRVNSVLPDDTLTEEVRDWWAGLSEAEQRDVLRLNPVGHLADPADIADFIVYLAADGSRYVSGENIGITGGRHMG